MTSDFQPPHTTYPHRHPASMILTVVPIVVLGLLMVTFALVAAPWPSDPSAPIADQTVSHIERLRGKQPEPLPFPAEEEQDKNAAWYGRRVFDGMIWLLVVAGYLSVLALWRYPQWLSATWVSLAWIMLGAVGVLYGALIGLYPGPILTAGGFALVLIGGGLGWTSQRAGEHATEKTKRDNIWPSDTWQNSEQNTGLEHNGTHSVA
ncbi:MAG: hypothetical protein GYB65_23215 [Chloroflexi bacterium]|nr:hypothetical protein [Chloroflexota bacterium]